MLVPVTAPIMILLITITAESRNAGADAAYQIYPRVLRCVIMSGGGVSAVSHTRDHDQWSGAPAGSRCDVSVWMCSVQDVLLALVDVDFTMFNLF